MAKYIDHSTQTVWAGLMQLSVRPESLFSAPHDTTTPPAEVADTATSKPTLIERRSGRPGLVARISMPNSELNDEVPLSPPPTHALLSPLPEANTLHAGHTPLLPRARSPTTEAQSAQVQPPPSSSLPQASTVKTVAEDEALTGALVLPTDPLATNSDPSYIALDALDQELGRIARQQRHLRGDFSDDEDDTQQQPEQTPSQPATSVMPTQSENVPPASGALSSPMLAQPGSLNPNSGPLLPTSRTSSPPAPSQPLIQSLSQQTQLAPVDGQEEDLPLSRKGSADSRRSVATEEVDGVKLKTPPSNFGTPIGQL